MECCQQPCELGNTILDAWSWCTGMTQMDGTGREVGGGFRMGRLSPVPVPTCPPVPAPSLPSSISRPLTQLWLQPLGPLLPSAVCGPPQFTWATASGNLSGGVSHEAGRSYHEATSWARRWQPLPGFVTAAPRETSLLLLHQRRCSASWAGDTAPPLRKEPRASREHNAPPQRRV